MNVDDMSLTELTDAVLQKIESLSVAPDDPKRFNLRVDVVIKDRKGEAQNFHSEIISLNGERSRFVVLENPETMGEITLMFNVEPE